jgi:hypothetical protein
VGLANTTFRRNFPDIAAELARQAAERRQTPPPSRYDQLQQTAAQLRQENRELRGQLELAYAVIQRITLENSGSASKPKPLQTSPGSATPSRADEACLPKRPAGAGSRSGPS